jgi:hypothetical protein
LDIDLAAVGDDSYLLVLVCGRWPSPVLGEATLAAGPAGLTSVIVLGGRRRRPWPGGFLAVVIANRALERLGRTSGTIRVTELLAPDEVLVIDGATPAG